MKKKRCVNKKKIKQRPMEKAMCKWKTQMMIMVESCY